MTIKYKKTVIYVTGTSILVDYIETDTESDEKRFFFSYRAKKQDSNVEEIAFTAGMVCAPKRMKTTMEDIKAKFAIFKDNGSGTIEDFLSFMVSQERNEKIEKLGI